MPVQASALRSTPAVATRSFLRIPPFPGSKAGSFTSSENSAPLSPLSNDIADLIVANRVGGSFWAKQPSLPPRYLLVRSIGTLKRAKEIASGLPVVLWVETGAPLVADEAHLIVTGECDPWHMLVSAQALISDTVDDVSTIATLLGLTVIGDAKAAVDAARWESTYLNPFTGEVMSLCEAIELCGFWRRLIDQNRGLAGALGFAFWKRDNVEPLLWSGSEPLRFLASVSDVGPSSSVAVWRSKAPAEALEALARGGAALIEVEDGFLRSNGLGADCVPPLSITVDRLGVYFDPSKPSELEVLLQEAEFDDALVERARILRGSIVASGLSKYGRGEDAVGRRVEGARHILVPGQVEDDRSVQTGGCGLSTNLELLRRVRERAPDAYILYKPHPDVVAGHRIGEIARDECLKFADEIVGDISISSLIAMVDEVHVNTSLAGFEALMREKPVTTYGVPFYAGWGLTTDLGPVPARRTARRELDELVAATLLVYPRYLDPSTGLPCPPEVVVQRLCASDGQEAGLVVAARRLQGKFKRSVRSLVS
jgi:capsular polysaccharide export protein